MFSRPLTAPFTQALPGSMLGRLLGRSAPAAPRAATGPVPVAIPACAASAEDERCDDLAQRVREVGEW